MICCYFSVGSQCYEGKHCGETKNAQEIRKKL